MTRVIVTPRIRADVDRIFDFLFDRAPESAGEHVHTIMSALADLGDRPQAGRPATAGLRELLISTGAGGYVALYRFDEVLDVVHVLALRSQREGRYWLDPLGLQLKTTLDSRRR